MFVLLSQSKCVLLVSQGLPCPQLSLSEFQAFRLRSFLELRHGGCSVWLAHGSSLLMVFGSLAPLWCLASVPSEHEADGSCASVLAERTHCVGPLRLMEVVLRFLPSEHIVLVLWTSGLFWHRSSRACAPGAFAFRGVWRLCFGPCRADTFCVGPLDMPSGFSIGHPRACAVCALALVRAVWHVVAE